MRSEEEGPLEDSRWEDLARLAHGGMHHGDPEESSRQRKESTHREISRHRKIKVQITLYIYGVKAGRGGHPTSSKNKSSIFAFIPMYTFLFRSFSLLPSPFLPAKFRDRSARANPSCCIPQAGSRRHLDPV